MPASKEASLKAKELPIFIVITGGPSVGKTTIISLLKERGYTVLEEQATAIIKEGEILPWVDRHRFQQEVLHRQLISEEPFLGSKELVFLDRGCLDGEAYYLVDNTPPPDMYKVVATGRYSLAFVIEALPFWEDNGVRFEKDGVEFTKKITPIIERVYTNRRIKSHRVPAMPPEQRADFVLNMSKNFATAQEKQPIHAVMPGLAYAT